MQASIDEFCSLDEEVIADAKTFDIRHDKHSEKVSWKILPDNRYTKEDDNPMVEVGVENLWKRGPTGGRCDYPDFGQYLPRNWFVAIHVVTQEILVPGET
ncbi:hypothetical protein IV203_032766 [Nitzschia inconspicua]|uniref:Uncharacterized protein n=1 Tax=Nitzschia inconspicua TaxID=303405 RepID=A0A9K3PFD1_9STRA|nr:hypothetical protein IV203_032766 [Nitzschia inconspicua]